VPQERLVPIALLRSGRCECDDDPLLRTTARTTDVTEPVRLRVSTVTSASRPYQLELRRSTAVVTASGPCRRWCRSRCPSGMSRFIGQDLLSRHEDEPVH
jgi:hypothetical protein